MLKALLDTDPQGDPLENLNSNHIPTTAVHKIIPIEIELGKTFNINVDLDKHQQQKPIQVLYKYKQAFSWDYSDMKGLDLQL